MRNILLIAFCLYSFISSGQDSAYFDIILKNGNPSLYSTPSVLDTVFLNSKDFKQIIKVYTNLSKEDSIFRIPNVAVGKYWLKISSKGFDISPVPIVVCSKCSNQFKLFYQPHKQGKNGGIFQTVEVSPSYIGDYKALSKDFLKALNKKEKKLLKESSDFSIHFFVTKEKLISDISFTPSGLSQEVKNIVTKGLDGVRNWRTGILNGRIVDAEYNLEKQDLLGD